MNHSILLTFIQSWNLHGGDETAICSGALDIVRAHLGDRPCCVWKNTMPGLHKLCERGMMDLVQDPSDPAQRASLQRCLETGEPVYGPISPSEQWDRSHDGVLNVPVKIQEEMLGIFSIGIQKKEAKDRAFTETLQALGRLIAVSLQYNHDSFAQDILERKLRGELDATARELSHTNNRLIQRVRELKEVSKELERKVEDLTHANRAKDEFLSMVSHELRTPLTSLTGFLCVLIDQEAGPLTEAQSKFLSIAKQSADRLNVLISDLLDVSRIESGRLNLDRDVCSMDDIIRDSLQGLKKTADIKEILLVYLPAKDLPPVYGDFSRLQQVIDNIVSNAIKFTPYKGRVTIRTENKGDAVSVSVQDTGPGIGKEEQKKIFDMFYQVDASTRRAAGGAGLGLAIANGIVVMHGGHLWVESEKGSGTTFKLAIPRHKEKKAA